MGRPREFDVDTAVDAAMRAFWVGGYEATSTQDLCDATGLCRSSIYHTFGSKRELYERALTRYDETYTGEMVELLRTPDPVRDRVDAMFRRVIDSEFAEDRGCLTMNALIEMGERDQELTAGPRQSVERLHGELECALEASRCAGELPADRDVSALASFIQTTMSGMRVMRRAGADRAALEAVAGVALSTL